MDKATFITFAPTVIRDEAGLPKRFEGIAYSGGVIPGYGWNGDSAIDLSTLKLPDGEIFALVDHDHQRRAGSLTARLVDNQIHVAGKFFASSDAGKEVAGLFAEGAPWQMSVGIQAKSQQTDDKRPVNCNGQTLQLNTLFTDAHLREVSFVPVGADPSTSAVAFAHRTAFAAPAPGDIQKGTIMTLEELQSQVNELTIALAAEKTRADASDAKLATIEAAARTASITQLAADIGRELTEAETGVLSNMEDAAFQIMSVSMRSLKPAAHAPNHLFSEQATGGNAATGKLSMSEMNAKILNQLTVKG